MFTLLKGHLICLTIFKHVHSEQVHYNFKSDREYKNFFLITTIVFVHFSGWNHASFCLLRYHVDMHKVTHEWVFRNLIGNENCISYCNIYFTILSHFFKLVNYQVLVTSEQYNWLAFTKLLNKIFLWNIYI